MINVVLENGRFFSTLSFFKTQDKVDKNVSLSYFMFLKYNKIKNENIFGLHART